jgi:hypothetical protein
MKQRLICLITILLIYVSLTITSCIFYILILSKRGRVGKKVSPTTGPPKEVPPTQQLSSRDSRTPRIAVDIATVESITARELFNDVSLQEAMEKAKELKQCLAEIHAAIRCQYKTLLKDVRYKKLLRICLHIQCIVFARG